MSFFLGIDVGTSATKAVLFRETGEIAAAESAEYPLYQPQNGWAEQNPRDWAAAAVTVVKALAQKVEPSEIAGIGVSGQMHGLVLLDAQNQPLCNSLIWCDQRTEQEAEQILQVFGKENYLKETCNAPNTSFTLSKLLWVQKNRPEIFKKVRKVLLPKDYINFCLTGIFATDVSDASGTGYFNVPQRSWSAAILEAFHLPASWLPQVQESCTAIGTVSADFAAKTGLSTSTVVCAGAGDQAAAALGNGILSQNETSISLGTSGVVFSAMQTPAYDKDGRTHTFCHAVPNMWHIMGVTQACGLSVHWFKENFAKNYSYKALDAQAEQVRSDGILYLPYLMGERTPHLDPNCRGAFVGLSASHTVYQIYRALLEGVCFSLRDCCDVIQGVGTKIQAADVCGGGANSPLWLQMLSDCTGARLSVTENPESGTLGAAILASVAAGVYPDVQTACAKMHRAKQIRSFSPDAGTAEAYEKAFKIYRALYGSIKQAYEA